MNRFQKYLSPIVGLVFLLPLLFASCSGDKLRQQTEGKPNSVQFVLNNSLRAAGNENLTKPTPALDREKKVEKLYAVVFRTSSGIHYKTIECTSPNNDGKYEFDNQKSGEFFFFLVANPDADLLATLQAGPSTPDDLGMLVAKQTPGEDNQATNFLMTSDRVNVTVNASTSTAIQNPIKLVRVAARFDFYNKIEDLVINKVTFGKRYVQSHLFAQVGKMNSLTATENQKEYAGTLFQSGALVAQVYGYETDIRNEIFFTIEATYKGKPLEPQTVRLENFVIKRNHLYNIILHELGGGVEPGNPDDKFGKLKYEIVVNDWEEDGNAINMNEDMLLKPLYVDFAAELKNASYMTPYLSNSPKLIYTTTKKETEVTLRVGTYIEQGSIAFADGFNSNGYTLTEQGTAQKDAQTGKITRTYKLTIPAKEAYEPLNVRGESTINVPSFTDIKLVAKNFSGQTTKEFTVKHGRYKMPLEYLTEAPLNPSGDGFSAHPNKFDEVGFFALKGEANDKYAHCTINGKKYRMIKDMYELHALIPFYYSSGRLVGTAEDVKDRNNVGEWIVMPSWSGAATNGQSYIARFRSDYKTVRTQNATYAIRFKNGDKNLNDILTTAYRYTWVGDFKKADPNATEVTSYFTITTRYLGANWNGTVDDIANEEFWQSNNSEDAVRKLYATGSIDRLYTKGTENYHENPNKEAPIATTALKKNDEVYSGVALVTKDYWYSNALQYANRDRGVMESVGFPIWLFEEE